MRELKRGSGFTSARYANGALARPLTSYLSSRAREDGEGPHVRAMIRALPLTTAQREGVRSFSALRQPQDDPLMERVVCYEPPACNAGSASESRTV